MPIQMIPAIAGDASEYGIIKFFHPLEDITKTRNKYPLLIDVNGKIAKKPFNSFDKMSHVIVNMGNGVRRLYIKGAP